MKLTDIVVYIIGALLVVWFAMWLFGMGPYGPERRTYQPRHQQDQQSSQQNDIRYTGKSCLRAEGTIGREGYGSDGGLGCWRF